MTQTAAATPEVTQSKTLAILAHLGGLFTSWLAPLIIYLISKSDPSAQFTSANAKESLNFQLTVIGYYILCFILSFIVIGIFLFWIVMLANLVLCIVASVKASNGTPFRYPLTIRLIK
ncbi:DUF4870 domain-containing protein [Variovorax sp. J22R115]|uniref:DUF4870 domain-containing protein n=1 Tax=Variovorax sp. J22R115 TaxID=3053509 RepID=UPI0025753E55|nr:DUF4870 domain-containing protein [Variovorax sp. J22R115]MDM0053833.1 DUF4870 domain-containing protein [Variovorax sp. J22R115]